ncbi:MAG: hypothetical protein WCK96_12930 [Methylococcales bacterium]
MTFDLGVLHQKSQPHLFADFAELILAVHYDNNDDLSQAKLEHLWKEMPHDLDELDKDYIPDNTLEDCWTQLEYRQSVFAEFYPFVVKNDQLLWKVGQRTDKQCLYLFLLVCSRLRSFENDGFRQYAAKAFTQICREALQVLSGENAVVRIFDANSDDRRNHYGTDLRLAMKKLAQEMGGYNIVETEIAKLSSSGDYGLDLIAVHNFDDGAVGSYNIVGQCGAQETEWLTKTLEAHPIKFKGLFTLLNEPDNLMFIPISYREATGSWVATHKIAGCLLIDRHRILNLLNKKWNEVCSTFQTKNTYLPLLQQVCPSLDIESD